MSVGSISPDLGCLQWQMLVWISIMNTDRWNSNTNPTICWSVGILKQFLWSFNPKLNNCWGWKPSYKDEKLIWSLYFPLINIRRSSNGSSKISAVKNVFNFAWYITKKLQFQKSLGTACVNETKCNDCQISLTHILFTIEHKQHIRCYNWDSLLLHEKYWRQQHIPKK